MLREPAELPAVKSAGVVKCQHSATVSGYDLPPLKEIHIVELVQLYRKLKCSLYFRHDIIPLITCPREREKERQTHC